MKQPHFLPEGFIQTSVYYNSGNSAPTIQENASQAQSPLVRERIEAYMGNDAPYILLTYERGIEEYVLVFERAAISGEALPAGEGWVVGNEPAVLQTEGNRLALTWISAGTWLTLEGTLGVSKLIQIAEQMATVQSPSGEAYGQDSGQDITSVIDLPYCNPQDVPPDGDLFLGSVNEQRYWGSVWINLFDRNMYPETISYGTSLQDVTEEALYRRALHALEDRALAIGKLDYPSINIFITSDQASCLEPDQSFKDIL